MRNALIGVALAASTMGCQHYAVYGPAKYDHDGVTIIAQRLELKKRKLRLRFTFANHTDEQITVDRNQMTLKYPDGGEVGRFKGTFGGVTSGRHVIPAG